MTWDMGPQQLDLYYRISAQHLRKAGGDLDDLSVDYLPVRRVKIFVGWYPAGEKL